MCYGIDTSHDNYLEKLADLLAAASVIIMGPGLGLAAWGQKLFTYIRQRKLSQPMILDADALNILASNNAAIINSNCILTPHPGEAARLLNITTKQVQQDRIAAINQLQTKFKCTIILKGAGTLIKSAAPTIYVCNAGNPGMASGGMGDVLSGAIGGLVAQGLDLDAAARLAVITHATAGDWLAATAGQVGMLATDLIPTMRKILNAK
jgi:NAD(P)H-hydrate epimerase